MKNRKSLTLFASVLVAGGVLAGCNTSTEKAEEKPAAEEQVEETEAEEETQEEATTEQATAAEEIKAFQDIKAQTEKSKEGQEVDWEQVSTLYNDHLKTAVNQLNGEYDQAIEAAISGGQSGELEALIAHQLIDKTTQAYFYQKQKRLHQDVIAALEAKDTDAANASFEELKAVVNDIIVPTAEKRDGYYELTGEASLVENINNGLKTQEEALANNDVDSYKIYTQLTDKSVYRSYYLAANSYAEKIEAAVKEGKEEIELQNMQAEAWGFLQAIKESLSGGDEAAATRLNELFTLNTTNPADIKADEVNSLFVKAIVGKVKSYHEKAPVELDNGNVTEAQVKALEGNMFLKAIEIQGKEKLGEEKYAETMKQAEAWFNAIAENNKEEAATQSEQILMTLETLTK
ncbi:hypothetical protein [Metabacillus iocasae]|uniref:Nucleic acid-binding Zn-ribbon protein n=1 Tax=Priestia iocasae TaxID=2291674 RepID=A0ABS2QPA4_9BACI|nr:hypothetical protein [Metabacillus iocasae]MBM7701278.1 putative nucleic acid-binding Zn-ribbon protein [Metabacillus iocasae]